MRTGRWFWNRADILEFLCYSLKVGRRGFGIAELIVTLGLFAVVSLFLIGLITTNLALQSKSDAGLAAVHAGEQVLDRWKSLPYNEIANQSGQPVVTSSETVDGLDFDCELSVTPLQPAALNPGGRVLELDVLVQWQEQSALGEGGTRQSRPQQLRLSSVVGPTSTL